MRSLRTIAGRQKTTRFNPFIWELEATSQRVRFGLAVLVILCACIGFQVKLEAATNPSKNSLVPANIQQPEAPLNDDSLLILEVILGQFQLAEAISGYLNDGSLLLPLSELVTALDFAIDVKPESGTADGWFIRENKLFSLDLNRGEVVVEGIRQVFDPGLIGAFDGDIYVDVRILAKWFPLDIKFDLSNLLIELESRVPLPVEERLDRDERRGKLLRQRKKAAKQYPEIPLPYQVISWPITDSSMEFSFSKNDSGQTQTFRQTTFATADVGTLSAELFLNADGEEFIPQARLKIGKKDPDNELLGKLRASEFAFGDISGPQLSMVSNSVLGLGVMVSNLPLDEPTEFDRISLEGDLGLGWEVELYRNEVLLDFRVARTDGRYEFDDIPLLFGVNVLRLAFFGPQGQTREEVRQIRVSPDQVKPGEHRYRFAVNQQERQILIGDLDDPSDPDLQGKNRIFVEYGTGITNKLSVNTNFVSVPLEGGHHNYVGISARAGIGPVFGRFDVVRDLTEGWATRLAAQSSFAGITALLDHQRLYDFVSETFESSDNPVEHSSNLRLDGLLRPLPSIHLPFSFTVDHEQTRDGGTTTSASNRLSTAIGAATVTNSTTWQLTKGESSRSTAVDGSFLIGGRIRDVRVRGQVGYSITPAPDIPSANVSGDWRYNKDLSLSTGVAVAFGDESITTFSLGAFTSFPLVAVGVNMNYSTANELNATMSLSFSSARDPRSGERVIRAGRMAETGAVSARVYLDNNDNRQFDEGDEPLENVKFAANGSKLKTATSIDGIAYLSGLDPYTHLNFAVEPGSLEDPFWIAEPEGVSLVLRPGLAAQLDFPVVSTGEIDGTVYHKTGKWANEVRDVSVQLVDKDGEVVKETKSAYDGFYLLDFIRPGKYTLRVDPEQLDRLKMTSVEAQEVEIQGDGTVLNGMDFILESNFKPKALRFFLASFPTQGKALEAWSGLIKDMPEQFDGLEPLIQQSAPVEKQPGTVDLYAGHVPTREVARKLCIKIKNIRSTLWCNPFNVQAR